MSYRDFGTKSPAVILRSSLTISIVGDRHRTTIAGDLTADVESVSPSCQLIEPSPPWTVEEGSPSIVR
jgi:hypothetical protein